MRRDGQAGAVSRSVDSGLLVDQNGHRLGEENGYPHAYQLACYFGAPMDTEAILKRFDELSIWKQGDQRAPHKPLLVLYALGLWQRGQREVTFRQAEPELVALLREFGPPRRSDHPEQPFWRLQRDGVWTVHAPAGLVLKTNDTIPRVGELRSPEVRAEFSPDVQSDLASDPGLAAAIATGVLER